MSLSPQNHGSNPLFSRVHTFTPEKTYFLISKNPTKSGFYESRNETHQICVSCVWVWLWNPHKTRVLGISFGYGNETHTKFLFGCQCMPGCQCIQAYPKNFQIGKNLTSSFFLWGSFKGIHLNFLFKTNKIFFLNQLIFLIISF